MTNPIKSVTIKLIFIYIGLYVAIAMYTHLYMTLLSLCMHPECTYSYASVLS